LIISETVRSSNRAGLGLFPATLPETIPSRQQDLQDGAPIHEERIEARIEFGLAKRKLNDSGGIAKK
jgi:hypothetical protein